MEMSVFVRIVVIFLHIVFPVSSNQMIRFMKVSCKSHHPEYFDFSYCYIKSVNRTYQYISIKAKLGQVIYSNITVSFAILKQANGLKPFLYNYTVDGCDFIKSRNRNAIHSYLFNFVAPYTNLNHSCPYDHDILVDKLDTNHWKSSSGFLAFPSGYYCLNTEWFVYNDLKATVRGCVTLNSN